MLVPHARARPCAVDVVIVVSIASASTVVVVVVREGIVGLVVDVGVVGVGGVGGAVASADVVTCFVAPYVALGRIATSRAGCGGEEIEEGEGEGYVGTAGRV